MRSSIRRIAVAAASILPMGAGVAYASTPSTAHQPKVLLVGTYAGVRGQYQTLQAAVTAARAGDWILVAPGDYKTSTGRAPA